MSTTNASLAPPAIAESEANSAVPGHPAEQLQVEEAPTSDEQIEYPTGPQLWLNVFAMLLVCFIHGLDLTIVAVTVPSLTDEFKTLSDIGWYSAVYGIILSSTNFFFGKLYTLFDMKRVYVTSVILFELGSLMCTVAPNSGLFIFGRALAGMFIHLPLGERVSLACSRIPIDHHRNF